MATTIDLGKIRIQWKGDYNAAVTYELLDVTKYKGDSYIFISTIAAAAKTPDITSEWELIVSGGDQWSSGTTAPINSAGNPGDFYLNTLDEKMYVKNTTNTGWDSILDVGGAVWTSGTTIPSSSMGEEGDFFFKTDDEKIYQKTDATTWAFKADIGGAEWTSGTGTPNNTNGEDGDYYIDTEIEKIYQKASGAWNPLVDIGGTIWTSGTTIPANSFGEDGDFFLKTDNEKIYKKGGGTWNFLVDIGGGVWSQGATTPADSEKEDGDFFVNTSNLIIYQKLAGTWTTVVNLTPDQTDWNSTTGGASIINKPVVFDNLQAGDTLFVNTSGALDRLEKPGSGNKVLKTNDNNDGLFWATEGAEAVEEVLTDYLLLDIDIIL